MKSLFTKLSKTLKKSNKRLNIDSGRSVSVEKDAVEKDMEWAIQRVSLHCVPHDVLCFDFDPVQRIAAVGTAYGIIHLLGQTGVEHAIYVNFHSNEYDDHDTTILSKEQRLLVRHVAFAVGRGTIVAVVERIESGTALFMLLVYDLKTKGLVSRVEMNRDHIISCVLVPVGSNCVLLGTNRGIRSINFDRSYIGEMHLTTNTFDNEKKNESDDHVMCMDLHPLHDQLLLAGMANGDVVLFDLMDPESNSHPVAIFRLADVNDTHPPVASISWHPNKDMFAAGYSSGEIAIFKLPKKRTGVHKPSQVFGYFQTLSTVTDLYWDTHDIYVGMQKCPDSKPSTPIDDPNYQKKDLLCGVFVLKLSKEFVVKQSVKVFADDINRVFFLATHAHKTMQQRVLYAGVITRDSQLQLVDLSDASRNGIVLGNFNALLDSPIRDIIMLESVNCVPRYPKKHASSADAWPLTGGTLGYREDLQSDMMITHFNDGTAMIWDIATATASLLKVCGVRSTEKIECITQWSKEAILIAYHNNTVALLQTRSFNVLPLRHDESEDEADIQEEKLLPPADSTPTISLPAALPSTTERKPLPTPPSSPSHVNPVDTPQDTSKSISSSSSSETSSPDSSSPTPSPSPLDSTVSSSEQSTTQDISPTISDTKSFDIRRITAICALQFLNKMALGFSDGSVEVVDIAQGEHKVTHRWQLNSLLSNDQTAHSPTKTRRPDNGIMRVVSLAHGAIPRHGNGELRHALFIGTSKGRIYVICLDSGVLISHHSPKNTSPCMSLSCVTESGDMSIVPDSLDMPNFLDEYVVQECGKTPVIMRFNNHLRLKRDPSVPSNLKLFAKNKCAVVMLEINLKQGGLQLLDPTLELSLVDPNGDILMMCEIHAIKIIVSFSQHTIPNQAPKEEETASTADDTSEIVDQPNQMYKIEFIEPSIAGSSRIILVHDIVQKNIKLFSDATFVGMKHYEDQGVPIYDRQLHNIVARAYNDKDIGEIKNSQTLCQSVNIFYKNLVTVEELQSGSKRPDIQCTWTDESEHTGKYLVAVQNDQIRTYKLPSLHKHKHKKFKTCSFVKAQHAQLFGHNIIVTLDNVGTLRIFSIPQLELLMKQSVLQADLMRSDHPVTFHLLSGGRLVLVGKHHTLLQTIILDTRSEFALSESSLINTDLSIPGKQKPGLLNRIMSVASNASMTSSQHPKCEHILIKPASGSNLQPCVIHVTYRETQEFIYGKSVADLLGDPDDDFDTLVLGKESEGKRHRRDTGETIMRSMSAQNKNRELYSHINENAKRDALFGNIGSDGHDNGTRRQGSSSSSMMEGIGETKSQMTENTRKVHENLEKLQQISEKTGRLEMMAKQFYENTKKL